MEEETKKTLLPRDVLALFGAHKLSDGFETGRIKQSPKKIYIHDEWNHLKVRNNADVSLLEFWGNKITFGDFVQPICLWESENEPTVTEGVATGWIKIESLMESRDNFPKLVQAPIQSNNECFLDEDRLVDQSRTTFCSGILNGSGVCNGDSGGGLFIIVDGIFYLKGIMSLSLIEDDGCDVSKNAVYTNFLKFKDWMKDIAAKGGENGISFECMTNLTFLFLAAVKKVFCIFQKNYGTINCIVTEAIDSEDYVLGSKRNTSIELFNVTDNRLLQFLPRHIGKKLPNLKDFLAWNCRLTVVRDFYFKNVGSLEFLSLADNQIATIEANAFDDLVSLRLLRLQNNLIETLDEKLFEKLVNMREISLLGNKIKFLSATTFQLLGGKLYLVDLRWNVCIDQGYKMIQNLNQIESDLRANCTK